MTTFPEPTTTTRTTGAAIVEATAALTKAIGQLRVVLETLESTGAVGNEPVVEVEMTGWERETLENYTGLWLG